jgi:hypothetical protein
MADYSEDEEKRGKSIKHLWLGRLRVSNLQGERAALTDLTTE